MGLAAISGGVLARGFICFGSHPFNLSKFRLILS
jgi:hypothetical protein